jgi:hypothetical protein
MLKTLDTVLYQGITPSSVDTKILFSHGLIGSLFRLQCCLFGLARHPIQYTPFAYSTLIQVRKN